MQVVSVVLCWSMGTHKPTLSLTLIALFLPLSTQLMLCVFVANAIQVEFVMRMTGSCFDSGKNQLQSTCVATVPSKSLSLSLFALSLCAFSLFYLSLPFLFSLVIAGLFANCNDAHLSLFGGQQQCG